MTTPFRFALAAAGCALTAAAAPAQFSFGSTSYAVGAAPDASASGDFDGDGDLDLATTSDAPDKVTILFNAGNGTFGAPVPIVLQNGTSPHTPIASDLDGDGDVDIAVSLHNANAVRLIVNNGGTFAPGASFLVGSDPRDLQVGDLDRDGDADLAVANRGSNSISILRNQGGLAFAVTSVPAGQEPRTLSLGDVTGDGLLDVAVAAHDSDAVVVLRNAGGASFVPHATLSTGGRSPEGVVTARLDGNATLDVAASGSNNGVEFAIVFLNAGGGAFGGGTAFPQPGQDGGTIVAGDFDVDGDRDLAIENQGSANVAVLPNNGSGAFGAAQTFGVGAAPNHTAATDLDGNLAVDLVVTNENTGNVTVLLNAALGASPMVSMCNPGDEGVRDCPCGNAPAELGRGCDNSAGTGGARLTAAGNPSLSGDTLSFTTSGQRATALSIVLQGTTTVPGGLVFGQGVRCADGTLKRLFTKNAVGGSITAPGALDPSVSARSAALGDPIGAGQSRFYLVYYRDPIVLGGCPAASAFNATQGGRVIWNP